jgi:penicillin-binding protein 1C
MRALGVWLGRSWRRRELRVGLLVAVGVLTMPWLALVLHACLMPLPSALTNGRARTTVMVLDRDGRLLREVGVGRGAVENPIRLTELSPWVVPALLAAEDGRFYRHSGVDPIAVARAMGQWAFERRIVSGASTLTQQLARTLEPRPRSLAGKWREMAQALRIEASLSKAEILEQYLSRVELGAGIVGIEAASRHYFAKPASSLDLSEAAALMSLPRGPSLYDPRRRPHLLERRRLRVLGRMERLGSIDGEQRSRAELTPLRVSAARKLVGAEHLSFTLAERYAARPGGPARAVRASLSAALQTQAERIALSARSELEAHDGSAMSLVVIDNASGDVLAYVGSLGYFSAGDLGANDGVVAKRQPGSALKPFVYAAAMEQLGYGPATLLPDLPRAFPVPGGSFTPNNYDQQFRGPVLLRQALASSLNLPALEVSSRLGPPRLLEMLRRFGFASLARDAEHYGVGLALGDGEVTLLELVNAYATLARGGEHLPARLVLSHTAAGGGQELEKAEPARRVLRPEIAALITDMLSDDAARAAGFGRDSRLALPFPVAAKTGTSKGFRDNWAVGYTREVTVGVWAGNFDGTPLRGASGITLAGPAFHELMRAAMNGRDAAPLVELGHLPAAEVCTLSGKQPTAACGHRRREHFVRGQEPSHACDLHVAVSVDAEGREVDERCGGTRRVLERYPLEYREWAERVGRPLVGRALSPTCPPSTVTPAELRVTFPRDGQRFALDPDGPARQEIVLSATSTAARLRFVIDGQPSAEQAAPFSLPWRLRPGRHSVAVEAGGSRSSAVQVEVTSPMQP